jgi:hypothetical protein
MSGKSNSPRGERTVKGKIEQQVRAAEEKETGRHQPPDFRVNRLTSEPAD